MISKGEKKISKILSQNRIRFEREFSFPDLVGHCGVPLRFDFAIFSNGYLYALLDYDGIQHFQFTKYFHKTQLGFRKAREWDRKKNAYCLRKGIPFLRIPYWDYDNLTLNSIFTTPNYLVRSKFHNDYLINGGEYSGNY